MQNYHEEETLGKAYDSRLMKRLLGYAKPYWLPLLISILLLVFVTGVELAKPWLIQIAIDDYIGSKTYLAYQPGTEPEAGIEIDGKVLVKETSRDETMEAQPYQTAQHDGENYLVPTRLRGDKYEVEVEGDRVFFVTESGRFEGELLSQEDNAALRTEDINGLIVLALIYAAVVILGFGFNYTQVYLLNRTGQHIVFDLRHNLFSHLQTLSSRFFDNNPVGRLITRVTNDTQVLNDMFTDVLVNLFKDLFMLVGIIFVMLRMNTRMALVSFALLPLVAVATVIFRRLARNAYRIVRVRLARINATLQENITGMRIIQIFHREAKKFRDFEKINKAHLDASFRELLVFAIFRPFLHSLYFFGVALLIWVGGGDVLQGTLEFGVLYAFTQYIKQLFDPINHIAERYNVMQAAMASSERVFQLMDTEPEITSAQQPVPVNVQGKIEFRNVWFAYNPDEWVLKDVSFTIEKGQTVAFVGATGAGKTSIISLISRLYDIQKGQILIDGVDIKTMDLEELRRSIAVVLQDVFMFSGTIADNIRLSNTHIDDERIQDIAEAVDADKFISRLPQQFESEVKERGATLSAGQRQLLAFARALAFDPKILVLDEATANIDTETEQVIQRAMHTISKDRTTIVVAHRLSTIQNADNIIVLHKGRILEMGSHQELLAQEGHYYHLYELQYKDQELHATS